MPDAMASVLLENWLEDADELEALERVESDGFADRQRVRVPCTGYRPISA
jgi:hypothetical protein